MTEVNPRTEADAQIARALQVVVDAGNPDDTPRRDYTEDELDVLFFALGMALVQLRKVPGGKEARDRFYDRAERELGRRGRQDILDILDILDKLDAEAKIDRIGTVLDGLGVPRTAGSGEPVSYGHPYDVEERVHLLGAQRGLPRPRRESHRRVQRVVAVKESDLTEAERAYAHPTGTPGFFEVTRWEDSEAVKIVKRTFGDDVDLSDGTVGDAFVKAITLEMSRLDGLRSQLLALAASIRPPEVPG